MGVIQKLVFTAGMNYDTAPENLQPGEARQRYNCRVLSSDNDEEGSIETMLGNTLVSYTLPAGGTYKVIGAREDLKRGYGYYMVYSSTNKHLILQYDMQLNVITKVLQEAATTPFYLNFQEDYLITGINIIELDANNHLLYWTDRYNQQKKINIEKAIAHSAGNYTTGYPATFDERFVYRIKQPQLTPPTYTWSNTASQQINYLFKKLFVFKVQYVYDDKEVSAWSPWSNYSFPATTNGGGTGEEIATQDNTITITVKTGSPIVKKIRIAAKEYASADFSLIAELDKEALNIASNTTYNYVFFNNGNYITLEVNESNKLFDAIPLLSGSQELIAGNRLVEGDITDGFDPVKIDMRMLVSYTVPSFPANPHFPNQSYYKSGGAWKHGIVYYEKYGNRSGVANATTGKTTELQYDRYGTTLYLPFITEPGGPTAMDQVPKIGVDIYHAPPSWASHYQIVRSKNEVMGRYIQFVAQEVYYLADDKTTSVPAAAAVYCRVFLTNILDRYKFENPNSELVYSYVKGDRVRFIGNRFYTTPPGNFPPYVGVAPGSTGFISGFFVFNDSEIVSWDSATQSVFVKMDGNVPLTAIPGALLEVYQPAENVINDNEILYECGECRDIVLDAWGQRVHDGTTPQLMNGFTSATYAAPLMTIPLVLGHGLAVNAKVKVVTSGYSVYGIVSVSNPTSVVVNTTGFTLVGTFNGGLSGTITRAASFDLVGGDCFRRYVDMPFVLGGNVFRLYHYTECENASNMFPSKAWNFGRPNRIDAEFRQVRRPSTIFYSESFIPETNINGLSSVFDTNFETYEDKYGPIAKLYAEDLRLIVFQALKVGLVPVNQIIYNDLSLQNTVGASSVVLSPQMVYYAGEYGIGNNPESFAVYGKVKYFVDILRGAVLRLSQDGITPISDVAKMHNYFTDKFKLIRTSGAPRPKIYGVYDVKFGEYIIAMELIDKRLIDVPAETIAFNEKYNAFSSFYSYYPDFMLGMNTDIVTFKNGALYKHNTNATHNNFYGSQSLTGFQVMMNIDPSKKKVLQAISMETNTPWDLVTITTPGGQSTHLIEANFEDHEDFQYSEIMMDENTPNVVNPIVEGNVMRSQTALIECRFTKAIYNKIYAVNIMVIPSQRSNM